MAKLTETAKWEDGIYQIETSDPVVGGPDGVTNRPARELANRTAYLKEKQEAADTALTQHAASRNHPDATLTEKGFVQLSSATNSDNETLAATPKAVKAVMDIARRADERTLSVADASVTQKGIVQLSSATDSASETMAATPKAVKAVMDIARRADERTFSVADAGVTQKGIVQLSSATNSDNETLAATPKAVKKVQDALLTLGGSTEEAPLALNGIAPALIRSKNLTDLDSIPAALKTLGLGSLADGSPDILKSSQNGLDIPDRNAFVRNLRLGERSQASANGDIWWRCGDTGLIVQWGQWVNFYSGNDIGAANGVPVATDLTQRYSIQFVYDAYYVNAVLYNNMGAGNSSYVYPGSIINTYLRMKSKNKNGFIFQVGESVSVVQNISIYWVAIGR